MMVTFMEVKGQQRSSAVFLESGLFYLLCLFLSYEQYHQEIFSALKDQPKNLQKPVRRTLTYKDRK